MEQSRRLETRANLFRYLKSFVYVQRFKVHFNGIGKKSLKRKIKMERSNNTMEPYNDITDDNFTLKWAAAFSFLIIGHWVIFPAI